jgi:hypothetical protein
MEWDPLAWQAPSRGAQGGGDGGGGGEGQLATCEWEFSSIVFGTESVTPANPPPAVV